MLRNYITIAFRNIGRNKVFSAINIIGLSVSLACCIAISLYVWNETHYDTFHKNISNVYRITEKQNQAGVLYNVAVTPGPLAPALQKDFPEIVNTVRFGSWGGVIKNGDHTYEEKNILLSENSLFSMFSFSLLKGNSRTALQSPDEIVITESTAEKYFGKDWQNNPSLLGETFRLNNETDFKLAGVIKDPPENSSIRFDILLPISYLFNSDKWSYKWNSNNYHTYIQLRNGTNPAAFTKKIEHQLHVYNPDTKDVMQLQPLKDQYLYSQFDFNTDWGKRSDVKYIKIFGGIGLLLLIIACANFINLSTARSLKRSTEVGIRKVNGASRKQLILHFLSESVIITMIAGAGAVVLLKLMQPYIQTLTGTAFDIDFSGTLFLALLSLFVVTIGFIAGIYPAFILSAFKPVNILKYTSGKRSGKLFHNGLVVFQFAISIVLVVCTIFMYRQFSYMQSKDLGFNKEQLISVKLKGNLKDKSSLFKHDLDNQTSIVSTSSATMNLVNVDNSSYMEWDGMQANDKFLITQANVDPDFIPTLGMQLVSGTNFSKQKTNDTATYIVNMAAVKRMGFTLSNVIGKRATFWGAKGTIIGVVKDFNFKSLTTGIEPFILRYQPQDLYFNLFVKTTPGKTADAIQQIQKFYKKYESDTSAEFSFIDDAINNLYSNDKRTAAFVLLFTCLTVFVGCLGLFGLTVFTVQQRTKEIGIRKVLGASVTRITVLLSKDFVKLVAIAFFVASPVAWWFTSQWLRDFVYRINISWWLFAFAGCSIITIALLTISFQAIKAAMANPVKSLRSE